MHKKHEKKERESTAKMKEAVYMKDHPKIGEGMMKSGKKVMKKVLPKLHKAK